MTVHSEKEMKPPKATRKNMNPASRPIGIIFLAISVLTLALSIYTEVQILALIGLGLAFWGALFILIVPVRYVEGDLLVSTAALTYSNIDRIITDLKYAGKSYYVPPYPRDVYIPDYLKGLKDTIVFVAAEKDANIPSIEEIAQGKFLLTNPKGILMAPPGLGLLNQMEKNLGIAKIGIIELCEVLPRIILDNFTLARGIEMRSEANKVNLTIRGSLYTSLFNPENKPKSIKLIGCPIASAVACLLAKTSGKAVTILHTRVSQDSLITETEFQIIQG